MTADPSRPIPAAGPGSALVLAMDTSAWTGSVALGSIVLDQDREEGRMGDLQVHGERMLHEEEEHAALLIPRIHELFEERDIHPSDLAGVAVGAGPGSFTGVRVAAATAKGLARSLEIPMWSFSSLASAAVASLRPLRGVEAGWEGGGEETGTGSLDPGRPRCVLFDARGDRVYAAAYRFSERGFEVLLHPTASTLEEVCGSLIPPGSVLLGEGAARHRGILEGWGYEVLGPPLGLPSAVGLLRLLAMDPGRAPVADPGGWEPDYLRASGAERLKAGRIHPTPP